MSAERTPSRAEVSGWSPQQLADYLKRMNLSGCDKVVLKNSISGSRFVNMSENDLQKFPKLLAPMVSKISCEISRKEEKRGLFKNYRSTPRYQEPETDEAQGWDDNEFDDEDDDYESPFSGDEDGSTGDYESPGEPDYEPPPTEPTDDHKLCPPLPPGDYIDNRSNHVTSRGQPPAPCPRPPVSSLSVPSNRRPADARRDLSPACGPRATVPVEPPRIFRSNKPGRDRGSSQSPVRGAHRSTGERQVMHQRRPPADGPDPRAKPPVLPPPSASISRTGSSARPPANRFDGRRETHDEAPKHNTFPLQDKSVRPRPGPPSRHGDSLPPNVPSTGSLPHRLHSALAEHRSSFVGSGPRPPPSNMPSSTAGTKDMDPQWYVGKVTRGQAESCLRRVQKDGAYLVRDSTRHQSNQPFTLMVLYQDKVFNIQIRQQQHGAPGATAGASSFLLGTGLKVQESFPSVRHILSHYSEFPLLLIDAKNRNAAQNQGQNQNQCLLTEPAGFCLSGNSWS